MTTGESTEGVTTRELKVDIDQPSLYLPLRVLEASRNTIPQTRVIVPINSVPGWMRLPTTTLERCMGTEWTHCPDSYAKIYQT